MPKLVKYIGITLLAALLAACDGKKDDNAGHAGHDAPAFRAHQAMVAAGYFAGHFLIVRALYF